MTFFKRLLISISFELFIKPRLQEYNRRTRELRAKMKYFEPKIIENKFKHRIIWRQRSTPLSEAELDELFKPDREELKGL